jgi:hypothetical protein
MSCPIVDRGSWHHTQKDQKGRGGAAVRLGQRAQTKACIFSTRVFMALAGAELIIYGYKLSNCNTRNCKHNADLKG